LNINRARGSEFDIASSAIGLGHLFVQNEQYDSAQIYLQEALSIFDRKNVVDRGTLLHLLAECDQAENRYEEAIKKVKTAFEFDSLANRIPGMLTSFRGMGEIYLEMGDVKKAEVYFKRAKKLSEELNDPKQIARIMESLERLYTQKKDFEKAVHFRESAKKIQMSLTSEKEKLQIVKKLIAEQIAEKNNDLKIKLAEIEEAATRSANYRKLSFVVIGLVFFLFFVVVFRKTTN